MQRKAIDLILLLAILVGGFLAWTSGRERAELSKEYALLTRIVGDLTIGAAFAAWFAYHRNRA